MQNHRRIRRQWCDERRMSAAEWNEVVFTDESRICLQHHDGRIRVWRHSGEKDAEQLRYTPPHWSCTGIEVFTTGSPHTNTIVNTDEIESGIVTKDDLVPFRCSQFPPARHHSKRRLQWVGVKDITRNRYHDLEYPSARDLRMVREDTGAPNEGTIYAWIAAYEAVECTRAFIMMWWSSRRLVYRGRSEPSLPVNNITQIHWSQHFLTTQSVRPN
ncbi:uncharacterized protein TNCV_4540971 [Trichonephila clavipes]|nr:uncharacterized protein TNCV_4540971 [Trichonephila clavipes]